jgi:Domain of unknown function (DUF4260)
MSNVHAGGNSAPYSRSLTAHLPSVPAAARRGGWLLLGLFCTGFAILEIVNHGPEALAMAAGFAIAPDLAMIVGVRGARALQHGQLAPAAVPWYNAVHRAWVPLLLLVVYSVAPLSWAPLFAGGLGWLAHIAIDRAAGFGLRDAAGFQRTPGGRRSDG